jgi:polygalacturonase
MGYGTIDGRGHLPMLTGANAGTSWWDLARAAQTSGGSQNNPRLLQITRTNGFTLYKITLKNSPNFHVAMGTCQNVTIWGVKVIAPFDARNTDGIDPGYSSNVTIANSYVSDGDDNIAVGGSNSPGATNITVINNRFGDGHGASIGSYTQSGVSNVLFSNLSFSGDAADGNQGGLHIKSDISRGGVVQNITYANVCMRNVRYPLWIDPFYTSNATGSLVPQYLNIAAQNVHSTTEGRVIVRVTIPPIRRRFY